MSAPDSEPIAASGPAPRSPWRSVAWLWTLALLLSALLVAAGRRWPQPLVPEPGAVWALVLGLPLLMALRLLVGDRLVGDRGESGD